MKIWERVVIAWLIAAMLFATHQYVGYLFERHGWKGMSAGDWGTWLGSIGTVGALIGTVVLARADRTERIEKQRAHALVVAAHLEAVIADSIRLLDHAVSKIDQFRSSGVTDYLRVAGQLIDQVTLPVPTQVDALVAVNPRLASELARAASILFRIRSAIADPTIERIRGRYAQVTVVSDQRDRCDDLTRDLVWCLDRCREIIGAT